jgi:hypothetical protein
LIFAPDSEDAIFAGLGKRVGNPWHEIDHHIEPLLDLPNAFRPNGWVAVTSFYLLECVAMLIGDRLYRPCEDEICPRLRLRSAQV